MSSTDYAPPVDKLLALGRPNLRDWPDYRELGIGPEQTPDLIRMATDESLYEIDADNPAVYSYIHAWRALAQLRAESAVEPLLELLRLIDEEGNDWIGEELPEVFAMIGSAAIVPLVAYLDDERHGLFARVAAARGLAEIGRRHPEARDVCARSLARQLESHADQDPDLNGFLIAYLLDLKAEEAAPVMREAFAAGHVDEMIVGDWDDVRDELGLDLDLDVAEMLGDEPESALEYEPEPAEPEMVPAYPVTGTKRKLDKARAKARRKQASQSRRKNRRR